MGVSDLDEVMYDCPFCSFPIAHRLYVSNGASAMSLLNSAAIPECEEYELGGVPDSSC